MTLTDEENIRYHNDRRIIEAQKRLDDALRRIRASLKSDGSAGYYLTVLPVYLRELEAANENLTVTEATVEAEIAEERKGAHEVPRPGDGEGI